MEIKNLSQLRKTISAKTPFTIVKHYIHPEFDGQIRVPNVVQTNGFYSVIKGDPEHFISKSNCGKGYWLGYGKASDWTFDNEVCTLYNHLSNGESITVWQIKFEANLTADVQ